MNNPVGLHRFDGRAIRYGLGVGTSDLIGWARIDGRAVFLAVEVKAERSRLRPGQAEFIDLVRRSGGIAGVCRSVDDFVGLIESHGGG